MRVVPTIVGDFLVASLCVIASGRGVHAQPLAFDRLDSRDGLSHNLVHALLQDRQGFLWIGTAAGLNRYDGVAFTVFRHRANDPTSVSSSTIRTLIEDREGTVWVGTGSGLDRYDARTGVFSHIDLETTAAPRDAEDAAIAALAADADGGVWALSFRGRLLRAKPGEDAASDFGIQAFVSSMAVDREGSVWITAGPEEGSDDETLRHFDRSTGRFVTVGETPFRDGAPGLGVFGDQEGRVLLSSPNDRTICGGDLPLRCLTADTGEGARSLVTGADGTIWFGSGEGLTLVDPSTGELEMQRVDPAEDAWLSNNVQALLLDRARTLWVGTLSGLYRHDPYRRPFETIELASAANRRDGAALAVHADDDGTLWAGTLGGGLVRVAGDGGRLRIESDKARFVWALHEDQQGTLWAGLAENGLCVVRRESGRLDCIEEAAGLIAKDAEGMLWVAGRDVFQLDPARRRVLKRFAWPSRRAVLEGALLVDGLTVWIGADGLYRCAADTGACDQPAVDAQSLAMLDRLSVYALHMDSRGMLWLGTTRGLARFDPASESFDTYFDDPTMDGRIVYSILPDDGGHLWLATNSGVVRFDLRSETFRVFDPDDAPGLAEYNRRAAFRNGDGRLFFGHLDGVTVFNPAAIRENPFRPPIVITEISRATPGGLDHLPLDPGIPMRLSYRDRVIRFAFAALNFTHAEENRYRYRLDGLDADWVDAGTERQAVYTNLPPGRYTFRVQGSNNDGLWSETDATVDLLVAPPFWQTWWLRLLVLLSLGALLYAAHRYRVSQLLRVERVRTRISTDLHDEVGSKLAALALTSETVGRRADLAPPDRRRLSDMAETARRMADDLRDIVWLANPRFDTIGDLVEKMRTTADAVLDGTPHSFTCEDGEAVRALDMEQRRQLFLFYKETLRNIDRHAEASNVVVHLACNDVALQLDVVDDGIGFDLSTKREATGLAGLRERARALNGEVEIDTSPGAGTAVRLRAPLRRMAGFRDGRNSGGRLRSRP